MQPTSAGWRTAFPRSICPQEHTWRLAEAKGTSLILCWKQPLPKAPSPLTQGTRAALPPHRQLDMQTQKVPKFMAFYFLIFPTYCPSAGLWNVTWAISCLCNYWRTEFFWVPTSWLASKYSAMRYQFSISFWGEKTQKNFQEIWTMPLTIH